MPVDPLGIEPLGSASSSDPPSPSGLLFNGLLQTLLADSAVSAIVGTRITRNVSSQQQGDTARMTIKTVSSVAGHTLGGSNLTRVDRIQFTAISKLASDCTTLKTRFYDLFDSLQGYLPNGVQVLAAFQLGDMDLSQQPSDASDDWSYCFACDYSFLYRSPSPQR